MFYEIAASPKLPLTPFIPFSTARCREFWEALPSSLKNRAVEDAKALCPAGKLLILKPDPVSRTGVF